MDSALMISGSTAAEIAGHVRDLVAAGQLTPGASLPPIRELARSIGVNRNTVAAAYRLLVAAGTAETNGRSGTAISRVPALDSEGLGAAGDLINLASGNPDPAFLPDARRALRELAYDSPLYGTAAIDGQLAGWADRNLRPDVDAEYRLVLANGAVDAVERLLTAHLTRGDVVAVEDPCFLSSIGTLRLNGFQTSPVPVDDDGLRPDELDRAIRSGREPSSSRRGRTTRPARASRRFAQESSAPSSTSTLTSSSSRMTTSPRCLHPGITGRRRDRRTDGR